MRHFKSIFVEPEVVNEDGCPPDFELVMWDDGLPPDPEHRCYDPSVRPPRQCQPPETE